MIQYKIIIQFQYFNIIKSISNININNQYNQSTKYKLRGPLTHPLTNDP